MIYMYIIKKDNQVSYTGQQKKDFFAENLI